MNEPIGRVSLQIRLREEDFQRLEAFVDICRKDNHSDIIYAIRRLHADSAFHYVHTLRSYGFKSYVLDPQQATHRKLHLDNKIASHRYLLSSTDLFRVSFVSWRFVSFHSISFCLVPRSRSRRSSFFSHLAKQTSCFSLIHNVGKRRDQRVVLRAAPLENQTSSTAYFV